MSGPPTLIGYVDRKDLQEIWDYLDKHSLGINKYRLKVNPEGGYSNCLGIVGKRCLPPDLSRQSWLHPRLHKLLDTFGNKYVKPHINWTSVQVNKNFSCKPHKDIGNLGNSYIVGFGTYAGGTLCVEDFDYNINLRGLLFNGSERLHWTKPWTGDRYSLVFHTLEPKARFGLRVPPWGSFEAIEDTDGRWKIKRLSDGQLFWGKKGLPHPLKGRTKDKPDASEDDESLD
jgi:hypothetical protein